MASSSAAAASKPKFSSVLPSQMPSPHDGPTITESWGHTNAKKVGFKFTWTIHNFSSRREKVNEYIESPTFPAGSNNELKWTLRAFPKGEDEDDTKDHLSLYLNLVSFSCKNTKLQVQFDLGILNDKCQKEMTKFAKNTTFDLESEWEDTCCRGFKIIKSDFLLNKANGLLPDDKLIVVCQGVATLDTHTFGLSKCEPENPARSFPHDFSLYEGTGFSDVTLSVDGKDIPAHKIVLATRSPVFAAMFKYEMQENKQNRVVITDMKYEVLREMLVYIYTGNSPKIETMAEDLLVAANRYDVSGLKKTCETVLASKLTIANAANLLVLADTYCAQLLKAEAIDFAITHAEEMMLTPTWNNMNFSHPHIIMEVLSKKVVALQSLPRSDRAVRTIGENSEEEDYESESDY